MPGRVTNVEVHTRGSGDLDVHWTVEGAPVAVDVAAGPTPEQVDHDHHLTVPAGVTEAVVPAGDGRRTYVSVAPHGGGPALVAADRRVPFAGITNFRDLGGYPTASGGRTRWGLLFRADALHFLTADDLARYDELGMRAVYDLRGEDERMEHPNPFPSTWVPLLSRPPEQLLLPPGTPRPTTPEDGEEMLRLLYLGLVGHGAPTIGSLLAALVADGATPAVFHCHGGKDRTGIVAATLLLGLGVDRDLVLDDYELTARYRLRTDQDVSFDKMIAAGVAPEAAAAVLTTPRASMAAALDAIDADHGGIEAWLTGPAGLSPATLAQLRARFVDPAPG